jgi:hypothetical protein
VKKRIAKKSREKPVRRVGVKLRSMREDLENWIQCSKCKIWRKIKELQIFGRMFYFNDVREN